MFSRCRGRSCIVIYGLYDTFGTEIPTPNNLLTNERLKINNNHDHLKISTKNNNAVQYSVLGQTLVKSGLVQKLGLGFFLQGGWSDCIQNVGA